MPGAATFFARAMPIANRCAILIWAYFSMECRFHTGTHCRVAGIVSARGNFASAIPDVQALHGDAAKAAQKIGATLMATLLVSITNRGFLDAAFEHMVPGEYAAITSFADDPLTVARYAWAARPWRRGMPVPGSIMGRPQNVYAAVSSFRAAADGTFHRRKDDFGQMHVVMVDDVFEKVDRKKLKLPPSAMIQTSPPSAQAYYFLAPTAETATAACARGSSMQWCARGLRAAAHDPGMRGVTRYGRLPVAVNSKGKYVKQLGQPFACRLTLWHPERRYTIAEIAKAFRLDLTSAAARPRPGAYTPNTREPVPVTLRRGEATRRVNDFEAMLKTLSAAGLYVQRAALGMKLSAPGSRSTATRKPAVARCMFRRK